MLVQQHVTQTCLCPGSKEVCPCWYVPVGWPHTLAGCPTCPPPPPWVGLVLHLQRGQAAPCHTC